MAGTRKYIARWRRIKHVAMVLCVLCVVLWVATCAVRMGAYRVWGPKLQVSHGSVSFRDDNNIFIDERFGFDKETHYSGELTWHWPSLVPRRGESRIEPNGSPFMTREWELPLWPLPIAFGAFAWYAGRRVKHMRPHVCATCGYDTRGLAAGACCPECGTACSV
ncbi:MAG TPA: hypothetical protein VK157_16385 [Phycisphaerales bacterium]|nr:hypothetical protein [Phycisphaerales bacterium]